MKKGSKIIGDDDWVDSNLVYQEYIKDRHHTHLSATRWKSVAGFVRFLGQKGIAQVKKKKSGIEGGDSEDSDAKYMFGNASEAEKESEAESEDESEEGEEEQFERDPTKRPKWFIKLIDKSPEAILASKSKDAAVRKTIEEESMQARQMTLVERQAAAQSKDVSGVPSNNVVVVNKPSTKPTDSKAVASIFAEDSSSSAEDNFEFKKPKLNPILEKLAAEELELKKKRKFVEEAPTSFYSNIEIDIDKVEEEELHDIAWIKKGLLIRIGNEDIGQGKYLNMLAVIDQVIQEFGAQVTVLKNGDQLLLDQEDCLPVSRVEDTEFDAQLSTIDSKIMSTALKTDKCLVLLKGMVGREGRVLNFNDQKFKVEISAAGSSQIHRKQLDLKDGQFCIYWE